MDRETATKMWPIVRAFANGHDIKMKREGSKPLVHPKFDCDPIHYEVLPKVEPVDLSVLVRSGIDCEFSTCENFLGLPVIGKLREINPAVKYPYHNDEHASTKYCRPRMNHIHYWDEGKCPLPEGLRVKVYFLREALTINTDVPEVDWEGNDSNPVLGFEVLGLSKGWKWPW